MVGLLGDLGDAVDEGDRLGEVLKAPLADDLITLALPLPRRSRVSISGSVSRSAIASASELPPGASSRKPVMRIVSLVPSATEMLFALGLGSELVAVTHECDYPPMPGARRA